MRRILRGMNQTVSSSRALLRHLPLVLIAVGAVTGAVLLRDQISFDTLRTHRDALLALRDANYPLVVAGFLAAYVLLVAFSLPGASVASVTGGFLFGLAAGTALNVTLARLKARLAENEVSVLLLLRLLPVVPFFVANLLPALVGVRLRNFAWTTAVGIVPGALVFTSLGVGVGAVFDRGETPDLSILWSPAVLGPVLGLALLAALPMLIRMIRGRGQV